jgi:N-sulfoglucosamine sulfohydrolase
MSIGERTPTDVDRLPSHLGPLPSGERGQYNLACVSVRPNILVITSHDSGRHYGCYGAGVSTPNIDALAADGVRCSQMFSVAPICSPSRGSLLTGQWPQTHGMMGLAGGPWAWELFDYQRHLSHVARNVGYSTHLFGHQHDTDYVERLGFDRLYQYLSPHNRDYNINAPNIARAFADFAKTRDTSRPFYAQMGFFETHTPWDFGHATPVDGVPVPDWCQQNDAETRQRVAALSGAMKRVDEAVGICMAAIREAGIDRDTLVLVNTDHGAELPRGKWTMLDGGLGIGFMIRYPAGGVSGGRVCDQLLSNVDFLPTLVELIGLPVKHGMDGKSFAPALRGEPQPIVRGETHHISVDSEYAMRTGRYKLIRRFRGERIAGLDPTGRPNLIPAVRLFDLERDPLELNNVAYDPAYTAVSEDLHNCLWRHLESVHDPILRGAVTTPFWHKAIKDYHAWRLVSSPGIPGEGDIQRKESCSTDSE